MHEYEKKYMQKDILKTLAHVFFRARQFNNRCIAHFAKQVQHKNIIEIGSGKMYRGEYTYSSKKYFDDTNTFLRSDINPDFGHSIVNVTKMSYREEFDVILCMNVLEHVYEFQEAIQNIYAALKKGGTVVVTLPVFYPLHDEPKDYWRFTEHALRELFKDFHTVKIIHYGIRQYPFAYYLEAIK